MHTPIRILWVTFDFPPRMSSGAYRPIKVYKYLDPAVCRVDFVTHGESRRFAGATRDESLLRDVERPPRVFRVPTPIPHDVLPALARRLRGRRPAQTPVERAPGPAASGVSAPSNKATGTSETAVHAGKPSAIRQGGLYRRFAMATYFPDHLMLWGALAALRCAWLQLRYGYDVIYTTSFPESAHLPGRLLRWLGVRWVADYRYGGPLWIKSLVGFRKTEARDARDLAFQRHVLQRADCVITQSEQIRADLAQAFGLEARAMHVVPSAFDEADFEGAEARPVPFAKADGEVHLLHVGVMEGVGAEHLRRLVDALNRLAAGVAARGQRLVVHAVGTDVFEGARNPFGMRFEYRHHGTVVHHDLPPYLLAADAFLISTVTAAAGNDAIRGFIPSKLWEYLGARRPVLMVGPKDAVWSILEQQQVGIDLGEAADATVSPDAFLDAVRTVPQSRADVQQFTWQARAASLQQIFASLHRSGAVAPQGAPIG
jgi:glycosyltransferase involved in cell wall biosynthesis